MPSSRKISKGTSCEPTTPQLKKFNIGIKKSGTSFLPPPQNLKCEQKIDFNESYCKKNTSICLPILNHIKNCKVCTKLSKEKYSRERLFKNFTCFICKTFFSPCSIFNNNNLPEGTPIATIISGKIRFLNKKKYGVLPCSLCEFLCEDCIGEIKCGIFRFNEDFEDREKILKLNNTFKKMKV